MFMFVYTLYGVSSIRCEFDNTIDSQCYRVVTFGGYNLYDQNKGYVLLFILVVIINIYQLLASHLGSTLAPIA